MILNGLDQAYRSAFKSLPLALPLKDKDMRPTGTYKYKFLKATTANIPGNVVRENSGSKLTIRRGGMLKVQHLVSGSKPLAPQVKSAAESDCLYRVLCRA